LNEKQAQLRKQEVSSDSDDSEQDFATVKLKKQKETIAHAMLDKDYWKRKNVLFVN
jgi:hypothetical protein